MLVQIVLGVGAVLLLVVGTRRRAEYAAEVEAGAEHIIAESDRPAALGGATASTGTQMASDEVQEHVTEPAKKASLEQGTATAEDYGKHHTTFDTMTENERDAVICASARAAGKKLPPWCQ